MERSSITSETIPIGRFAYQRISYTLYEDNAETCFSWADRGGEDDHGKEQAFIHRYNGSVQPRILISSSVDISGYCEMDPERLEVVAVCSPSLDLAKRVANICPELLLQTMLPKLSHHQWRKMSQEERKNALGAFPLSLCICSPGHEKSFLKDDSIRSTMERCGSDLSKYLASTKSDDGDGNSGFILNIIGWDNNARDPFFPLCVNLANGNRRAVSMLMAARCGLIADNILIAHLPCTILVNGFRQDRNEKRVICDQWVPRDVNPDKSLLYAHRAGQLGWNVRADVPYNHTDFSHENRGRSLGNVVEAVFGGNSNYYISKKKK